MRWLNQGISMRRLAFPLVAALAFAACGEAGTTSSSPAATEATNAVVGPPTFENIISNPTGYVGQPVEFKVSLALGKVMLPTGETATAAGQAWEDPPGTEHSVGPSPGTPDSVCIFIVTNDESTPVFPIQPIVADNLSPCLAGSVPPVLTGKVGSVTETSIIVDGQPATVKGLTLSDLNFKSPF
jgi:hypothetical protein